VRRIAEIRQAALAARRVLDEIEGEAIMSDDATARRLLGRLWSDPQGVHDLPAVSWRAGAAMPQLRQLLQALGGQQ